MSDTVIQVENLWKEYQLGAISHHTLTRDLQSWWARVRGKEDPNSQIDSRSSPHTIHSCEPDSRFWALESISFEVKQGDLIGIIGRNGAGKSTLLKILSQVTAPTKGEVCYKGRIASLLEVGTGFHPELTGRENIFLNGAILGMNKADIRKKLDEIIAFAEVEKFIDTPVKRYSSGMYVRLAFAVAAHLEPEILIVDEVLAVGDAQFQKKCLGKMEDVSAKEGRTVLFVSHNMGAIRKLCNRALLLDHGKIEHAGSTDAVINYYHETSITDDKLNVDNSHFVGPLSQYFTIENILINDVCNKNHNILPSDKVIIKIHGNCSIDIPKIRISIVLYNGGVRICTLHDTANPEPLPKGEFFSEITIKPYLLRPGIYHVAIGGDNGCAMSACSEWFFGNEIGSLGILEEWDEFNDYCKDGLVNIDSNGFRVAGCGANMELSK